MKIMREHQVIDAVAEPSDYVQVEIQPEMVGEGLKLYISVNGRTILRIGRIPVDRVIQADTFTLKTLKGKR